MKVTTLELLTWVTIRTLVFVHKRTCHTLM
nr:MAG TPA: hypothetical protein [Caudoviricetes sp.]DAL57912.1 MAG TPA_asm: hypothetical protein [Caudoviricetes sp.]